MSREFGKRTVDRSPRDIVRSFRESSGAPTPTPSPAQLEMRDPTLMRKCVLAVVLTVTIVGGMFLLPRLGQCDGGRSFLGLDWCRLMKATVEGGVRGVAIGRGTAPGR